MSVNLYDSANDTLTRTDGASNSVSTYTDTSTGIIFDKVGRIATINFASTGSHTFSGVQDEKIASIPDEFAPIRPYSFQDPACKKRFTLLSSNGSWGVYAQEDASNVNLRGYITYITAS